MSDSYPRWLESVSSEITSDFVQPLSPKLGDSVVVRLRIHTGAPVKQVLWHVNLNGENWSKPMKKGRSGTTFQWWEITWPLNQPEWRYSFILQSEDDEFWFINRRYKARYHLATDQDWVIQADTTYPSWISHSPVYQIFPDRFFKGRSTGGVKTGDYTHDGHNSIAMKWNQKPLEWSEGRCMDFFNGDLDGIRKKIAYLQDLGVGTIFLNPIFEAPTIHRYDCTDYFHVARGMGGNAALARLSKALHEAGMRIILDISINHTGIHHPWAEKALENPRGREATFYYEKPGGGLVTWLNSRSLPMLNYKSKALRKIMYKSAKSVLKKWIKPPYNIDGWRFDVGNYTGRLDSDQLGHEVFREVRQELKALNPHVYLTGEHWQDSIRYLQGDQWDGSMNYFACARALRGFAGERDRYIFGDDPKAVLLPKGLTGEDLGNQILQHFTRMPHLVPHMQLNILDSHDLFRVHNAPNLFKWELYKGMVGIQYLLPGTPNLYYGDEVGLTGWTETMEGVRCPMEWRQEAWNKDFREYYQGLNRLKMSSPALHQGGMKILYTDESALVLARYLADEVVVGIINKSVKATRLTVPASVLGLTEAQELFSGKKADIRQGVWHLELEPMEGGIYQGISEG